MWKKYSYGYIFIILFFVLVGVVYAEKMTSSNYRIIFGTTNSGGGNADSTNYNLAVSLGQVAAQKFNSTGYIVKAGFQYVRTLYPFYFSISDTSIDLGTLLPNSPSIQSFTVTINTRSQGYDVLVREETKLKRLFSSDVIPDTSCNGGVDTCTETAAALWDSNNAYGFGYRVTGVDASPDFATNDYYRPFPSITDNEDPAVMITSTEAGKNRVGTVALKANIIGTQAAGSYQTVLDIIAYPKY
ncbi:MAG: hypothetical protein NUV52_01570 [Candidatus Roizmanbacteria bacterium]|nr:hypothetical protein [Candidatus Roizmanbacteria bacterium]